MGQSASKEKFRDCVHSLLSNDISVDDVEFWDELWKIPNHVEEVYELIPAQSVRDLTG